MADSEAEVVAVNGGDADKIERYRVQWRPDTAARWMLFDAPQRPESLADAEMAMERRLRSAGGQTRVVEQRVVLVRGPGQNSGQDEAFVEWQRLQPSGHTEFFERNREAAERQASDTLAQADGLARALKDRRAPETMYRCSECGTELDALGDPLERPSGERIDVLNALERAVRVGWNERDRGERRPEDIAARDDLASTAARMILADARRAPEPAASSEPEESEQAMPDGLFFSERELWEAARTWNAWRRDRVHAVLRRLASIRHELRSGRSAAAIASAEGVPPVTDMVGCGHRMSSGAVSLTACGECGAEPGDDCADPLEQRIARAGVEGGGHIARNLHRALGSGESQASVHRTLDHLAVPRHAEPEPCVHCGAPLTDAPLHRCQPPAPRFGVYRTAQTKDMGEQTTSPPISDDTTDPRIAELHEAAQRASEAFTFRPVNEIKAEQKDEQEAAEADRVISDLLEKTGGDPLGYVMRGWAAEVEATLAEQQPSAMSNVEGMTDPDPWWRRLLQRLTP